jgi:hypothetical protein
MNACTRTEVNASACIQAGVRIREASEHALTVHVNCTDHHRLLLALTDSSSIIQTSFVPQHHRLTSHTFVGWTCLKLILSRYPAILKSTWRMQHRGMDNIVADLEAKYSGRRNKKR